MTYCTSHTPDSVSAKTHLVDTLATDEHGAEVARVAAPEQPKLAAHTGEAESALRHGRWQTLGESMSRLSFPNSKKLTSSSALVRAVRMWRTSSKVRFSVPPSSLFTSVAVATSGTSSSLSDASSSCGKHVETPSAFIQGVFVNWYPSKKLKYVKPRLGESTLT